MNGSRRSSFRLLGLLALALAASPASASAAPTWLSPATVSGSTNDGLGSVAVSRDGELIAVWLDRDAQRVMASVRPPGGSFGGATPVSPAGAATPFEASQVAIDGAGNAVVAWTTASGQVRAAVRTPGGPFDELDPIDAPEPADSMRLAVNRDGVAALTWRSFDGGAREWRLRAAVRPAGGGDFGPSTVLDGPMAANTSEPDVAVAPDGTVLVAWSLFDFPNSRASYAIRAPGGTFGSRQDVDATTTNDRRYQSSFVGVAADGEALAVYSREVGGGAVQFVSARRAPGAGSFTLDAVPFGAAPSAVDSQSFAMGGDGTAVFGFRDFPDVHGAIRAPGAGFEAPAVLPPADNAGLVTAAAVGDDGTAMLAWPRSGEIRVAVRRPGGSLEASEQVETGGGLFLDPAVAVDPAGNGVLTWTEVSADRTQEVIRAAGHDAAPPVLRGVRFPAGGAPGTPLPFSATPFDVWSPVTTRWSFGDGASAAGRAVRHAFATPGRFTAQVTATDAVGNAARAGRQINVTAPVVADVPPPIVADGRAPVVSGFRSTNAVFAVGRRATPVSVAGRRVPRGTTFHYTLSEAARVTIAIRRAVRGLRSSGRCRAATKQRARAILRRAGRRGLRRARCTRYVSAGRALVRQSKAGANAAAFSGRIGRRALRSGRHRALLTATDAAGNRSPTSTTGFRVVKPPKRA